MVLGMCLVTYAYAFLGSIHILITMVISDQVQTASSNHADDEQVNALMDI